MPQIVKGTSRYRNRLNIVVSGESHDECQSGVWHAMETHGEATFTLPTKAAEGHWYAFGHAPLEELRA